MERRKRKLIACFVVSALASTLLLNPFPLIAGSHTAARVQGEQVQPSPLRALQWWAPEVPYQPIRSRIAIVDSGADPAMDPSGNLGRNIVAVWDSVHKTSADFSDMNPDHHGTHIAGIVCGNRHGMVPSVPLLIVRSSDRDAQGNEFPSAIGGADGIKWAVDNQAQVIICPWYVPPSTELADAVTYAEAHGVIVVAGAGNDNRDLDESPSCWKLPNANLIRVAAVKQGNVLAPNSAYGHGWVDLAAPGDGYLFVESTDASFVTAAPGTSCASTFVATIAAMVRDVAPYDEAIPRILGSVDRVSNLTSKVFAGGVVNPERALRGEVNAPLNTVTFNGKVKKSNKKLMLSGTEVLLNQQTNTPILRIWVQHSLLGLIEPDQSGMFSYVAKGRFESGAQVRVQSSLGGEMTWSIP